MFFVSINFDTRPYRFNFDRLKVPLSAASMIFENYAKVPLDLNFALIDQRSHSFYLQSYLQQISNL
jgi:hypothetical protein